MGHDKIQLFHFSPSPGLIFNHANPPIKAKAAAMPRETDQPNWLAIQGVRVGEIVPPRLAPVFISPESVPAWALDKSTALLQNAPIVKYNQPAPNESKVMAISGVLIAAPRMIEAAARIMPLSPTQARPWFSPNF